ncbi:hypothetical protein BX265_0185 [Streptomyces sp. TLI_235]|nr:hypothetical protein [Streptomyces sp. TLI_235]PBC75521.1 hypothetical protein BX265_0185 [Streptomyces sp. TLI_235]
MAQIGTADDGEALPKRTVSPSPDQRVVVLLYADSDCPARSSRRIGRADAPVRGDDGQMGETEESIPEGALARLSELQHLVGRAVQAWEGGDLQTAYDAANAAMPAAAGAAAALNRLLELDRARAESDQGQPGGPAGQWLG